jgi:glycine C-acetyltransferase
MGKTGRGTEEALDLGNRADIINSTLGKALGGAMGGLLQIYDNFSISLCFNTFQFAGYTVGPKPLIDLLRQRSRPYLFSNSLAPSVVGSALKV